MRREIEEQEPQRDPVLAAALLEAYGDAPPANDRIEALRRRIRKSAASLVTVPGLEACAAEMPAERPRGRIWPRRPLALKVRGYALAAPALLAATVAGLLLFGREQRSITSATKVPAIPAVGYATPEQALTSSVSDAEFARTMTGAEDPAALLAIAVQPPAPRPTQ